MDERQDDSYWYSSETNRSLDVGRTQYGEDKEECQDNLADKPCHQTITARRMNAVSIGCKTRNGRVIPGSRPSCHDQKNGGCDYAAQDLCNDIARYMLRLEFSAEQQTQCYCWIDVASRYGTIANSAFRRGEWSDSASGFRLGFPGKSRKSGRPGLARSPARRFRSILPSIV